MKALLQSLKSLYGVMNLFVLVAGTVGAFGCSVLIPSAPPWAAAVVFAVAYVSGFLSGSFGADKRADLETKKVEITARAEVEKAYETERARVEAEAEVKRRNLAAVVEAQRRDKEKRENNLFRALIKSLDFSSKVLLWHIYSEGELRIEEGACPYELDSVIRELESEEFIECETVDFGISAYCVCDDKRELMSNNEDLFRNARDKTVDDLLEVLA